MHDPVEVRFPDRERGPYVAAVRLKEIAGRFEVVEVTLRSVSGDLPITGAQLRLPLASITAEAAAAFMQQLGDDLSAPPLNAADMPAEWHQAKAAALEQLGVEARMQRASADARRRYPADHLERVAHIYTSAYRAHRRPTKAVAEELGITVPAATKQVARARAKGFLPETVQGRAEGWATQEEVEET